MKGQKIKLRMGIVCFVLLIITIVLSIGIGRYEISFDTLYAIFFEQQASANEETAAAAIILFEVRMARIAAAILIGGALSVAGAAYQGIFKNPMVSPDILGAATGAGFGAALAILIGGNAIVVQLCAFVFGLIAVGASYMASTWLTRGNAGDATLTLVLTGMVISALFSAFISVIKYVGDPYDTLPSITFWLMGGLTYVTKDDIIIMAFPFFLGMVPLILLRWRLNVLTLPDEEAEALGINTVGMRGVVILTATLISSSSVAIGGMIGWVGLVVPHICRMLVGSDNRKLLPCAFFIGGLYLLIVDDIARCLFAQEIPLGVLTAVIGAPFFLFLMFQGKRSFL